MRRALTAPFVYLADLIVSAVRGWNVFFFTPADPTSLGLIRLIVGGLVVWSLGTLGLDLEDYVGSNAWVHPDLMTHYWTTRGVWTVWSFWLWVPDRMLWPVWGLCMGICSAFMLGLFTRATGILTWAIVIATMQRSPVSMFGFDAVLSTLLLYLAVFGASGQALSIDRLLRNRHVRTPQPPPPSVSANLTLRMIQLHFCLIYAVSGLAKLRGDAWWNGSALEYILITPEFRVFDLTWLLNYQRFLHLSTHCALFLEVTYPVLIWVRKLRPLMLAGIVGMHLGISLTLGLHVFSVAMIAGNLSFVSGGALRRLFVKDAADSRIAEKV